MTWVTTDDVERFLGTAGPWLLSEPVANNVLLTEAGFWQRLSDPAPGARFGWWAQGGSVGGAFVHLPDHAVLCSPLSPGAVSGLPGVLRAGDRLAVAAEDADDVAAAWRAAHATTAHATVPHRLARLTFLRLAGLRARPVPDGVPRVADAPDLPLLRSWFDRFRERYPEDASSAEFVVDHPLADGAVVLWEVAGRPVAMSSRTAAAGGAVRMGLSFQPSDGTAYADAVFDAGCVEATRRGDQVLALGGGPGATEGYRARGFVPVLDRVVLALT